MIRIHSLAFKAGESQLALQIGWYDPKRLMSRVKMATMLTEALRDFQTRVKLSGKPFDVEFMCEFMSKREAFGANLAKVMCADASTGIGAEWGAETKIEYDVSVSLRSMSEAELAARFKLAEKNEDAVTLDAINAENERRKV